jgi:hypothetical protein
MDLPAIHGAKLYLLIALYGYAVFLGGYDLGAILGISLDSLYN